MLLKLVTGQEQPKVTVRVLSVIFSPNLQDSCFAVMSLLVRGCLTWANKYNTLASEKPFISGSVSKISIHRRQLCSAQHDQPTAGRSTGEGHLGKTPESTLRWLLIDGSHQSGDRKIKKKNVVKLVLVTILSLEIGKRFENQREGVRNENGIIHMSDSCTFQSWGSDLLPK